VIALINLVAPAAHSFPGSASHSSNVIVVSDVPALVSALNRARSGQRILLRAGTYEAGEGIYVPDGVAILGEGVMRYDAYGLPTGIEPAGRTIVRASSTILGDVITLGNGASMRRLVIEDRPGRLGNGVVISSRVAGDSVTGLIDECEIINPNPVGVGPDGPRGRAVLVVTRNPNLGLDPPPHAGSSLSLNLSRSVVRSSGGGSGVFAINFAPASRVALFLSGNVIGGGLDATGGVSRPDPVRNSSVTIHTSNNLYRSDSSLPTPTGWLLGGGTDAPAPGVVAGATLANVLRITSVDDAIEGFAIGIFAMAGRRNSPLAGPSSNNEVNINAVGLVMETATADLMLYGERSFAVGMSAGDGNLLRLGLRGATGSGARDNQYEHSLNFLGIGNRLQVVGSPTSFARTNQNIIPAPPAQFFASGP
jgi:hypothetical protein